MVFMYILQFVVAVLGGLLDILHLPTIETLPTILGVDIDTQLSQGVGMFYTFADAIFPIYDVFLGLLVLMGYYAVKMGLRFFLGHRAPQ